MRWILPAADERCAASLAHELGLHPVCASILVARGYSTPRAADDLLKDGLADLPDPSLMKGMDAAVERAVRAIESQERVTLYGDYDVDGVTSTATLATFWRAVGGRAATYIPKRLEEGYGLNADAVRRIAADGTRLLVTLDCGISAQAEVALARSLGLDVLVLDHHQVATTLPDALAILDPHQPGCQYPGKQLCAAGIAFVFLVALRRRLREAGHFRRIPEPNLREYLDLVALGTVADVVPLLGVNRILVKHGLDELARSRRVGVRALKAVSGFAPHAPLTAGQVAFRLAPRINAAGRLADADAGLELLTTSDDARAETLARSLDASNTERQGIERRMLEEAVTQADGLGGAARRSLVLAQDDWHPGVVGIVASRIVERYHRPTFVIALSGEEGRGSGRSIERFHLFEALERCAQHLSRYGGHRHAAGLSLGRNRVAPFREALEQLARAQLGDGDLVASCRIDAVVAPEELDERLVAGIQRLAPFGAGNPEPVLAAMQLSAIPRVLASKSGGAAHLKLAIRGANHLDVIGFGLAERAPLAGAVIDAAFHLGVDEWRGSRKLTLRLKDLRDAA